MLKLKKLKKHFVQFIHEASKYVLFFFVIVSFFDLYFYYTIWNSKTTNLFVELRLLVAAVVTIFEIVALFCKLQKRFRFDIFNRKRQAIQFDYEPDDFFIVKCYKEPPKRNALRIQDYATHLQTIDDDVKTTVYTKLWEYISKHRSLAAAEVMDSKMLPTLVKDLESTNLSVRVYSAKVIKFLSHTKTYIKDIVEAGAIPPFIKLLKSDKINDRYNANDALGKICADGYGTLCIQEGIIEPLIKAIDNSTDEKIKPFVSDTLLEDEDAKNIATLFIALCRSAMDDETSLDSLVLLLPTLKKLSNLKNDDILILIISLVKDLMKAGPQYTQLLIDFKVFKLLVEYLPSVNHELQQKLYSCFMNFCFNNGENVEHLIDSGVLSTTKNIYDICDLGLKNCILEFLLEVVSKKSQYDEVISAELVPLLLASLNNKNEEIQDTAFLVLSKIVKLDCDFFTYEKLSDGYLPAIFNQLDYEDLENVEFALLCLETYLKKFWDFAEFLGKDILDESMIAKIQQLQMRPFTGKEANEVMATYVRLKDGLKD